MAKRQRDWARRRRNQLHFMLGNKCCDCGTTEDLQLDCEIPQGNYHHKRMEWSNRMSFYWKQFWAGNLRLRCRLHNGRKGGVEDTEYWRRWRAEQEALRVEEERMQKALMCQD